MKFALFSVIFDSKICSSELGDVEVLGPEIEITEYESVFVNGIELFSKFMLLRIM